LFRPTRPPAEKPARRYRTSDALDQFSDRQIQRDSETAL
jgi:hypothetical protein